VFETSAFKSSAFGNCVHKCNSGFSVDEMYDLLTNQYPPTLFIVLGTTEQPVIS
jgi:hypothetical protein